jgi:hypothetical protein
MRYLLVTCCACACNRRERIVILISLSYFAGGEH